MTAKVIPIRPASFPAGAGRAPRISRAESRELRDLGIPTPSEQRAEAARIARRRERLAKRAATVDPGDRMNIVGLFLNGYETLAIIRMARERDYPKPRNVGFYRPSAVTFRSVEAVLREWMLDRFYPDRLANRQADGEWGE